jgi:hypothetical protein
VPRFINNRLKDRLSSPISPTQACKDPDCRHPFSMHHALLGCTYKKHNFGRNGFCRCDGFVVSEWGNRMKAEGGIT